MAETSSAAGRETRTTASAPPYSSPAVPAMTAPADGVVLVEEAGCCAGSAFDDDLETGSREPPDRLGYERDPAFAGGGLTRNDDAHETNVREGISVREGNLTPRDRDRAFHHGDAGKRPESRVHAARVGAHADAVARRLGWSDERLGELSLGARAP